MNPIVFFALTLVGVVGFASVLTLILLLLASWHHPKDPLEDLWERPAREPRVSR